MAYTTLPAAATLKLQDFTAHVSDEDLSSFQQLLKLSRIGPKTYENTVTPNPYYGVSRQWLSDAKAHWESKYDWRKTEKRINSYPNYTVQIEDINVHFLALFSKKADAVPIALLHGWPGSFLEFLAVVDILKSKYSEDDLPYHVIVPSLPGYGYSDGPPLDRNYQTEDMARVIDKLMKGLGFESGYVSQGGDIGSFVTRILGAQYDSCKATLLNFCIGITKPDSESMDTLTELEKQGVDRAQDFGVFGNAYAKEHGTRPATIGLVLSSSPIALLTWIAEKFQVWTDEDPPLDEILDSVTLYWFTDSFPRAIYPYRQFFGNTPTFFHENPDLKISKPMGYTFFPWELAGMPPAWVKHTGNMVFTRSHDRGGHFAAMEKPKEFTQDMEDFIQQVFKK